MIQIVGVGILVISASIWVIFISLIYFIVRELTGEKINGVVIEQKKEWHWDEGFVYFPIIEYELQNSKQQFQSSIFQYKPFSIGSKIQLVRQGNSDLFEQVSISKLFLGAIMILFLALLGSVFGLVMVFPDIGKL